MRTIFSASRYLILIAVIGLLLCALAVFVFGGMTTVTMVFEAFGHGEFNAEGARLFSTELVELIDLFLLGTVLLITSVGLYELFLDPGIDLPAWLSVSNLDQLKMNLVAVIIVMLVVLFLGEAGAEWREGQTILEFGAATALVIAAASLAVFIFQRVHQGMHAAAHHGEAHAPAPADLTDEHE
jgi:uncharacterized membrane protein YqhA